MVNARSTNVPVGLLVAASLLALLAVHEIGYAVSHAAGDGYATSMTTAQHDAYWPVFVVVVLGLTVMAGAAARSRARFAQDPGPTGVPARARLVARVWLILTAASVVGFVVLENLERLVVHRELVGLAPLAPLSRVAAIGPLLAGISALALAVVAVVVVGRTKYAAVLNRSYADLVADGVFSADFRQSPWAVDFVAEVVGGALAERRTDDEVRILECGCGSGIWLEEVARLSTAAAGPVRLFGFDLSPDMAAAARARFDRLAVDAAVWEGDVLDGAAYRRDGDDRYDLVFAYDVVQQLPGDLQQAAVDSMLAHVRPGGRLIVFDHDADTRYGRIMGTKKWLRRYLRVPLVPAFYIHARYPRLDAMRRRLVAQGLDARIVVEKERRKRALVVEAGPSPAA